MSIIHNTFFGVIKLSIYFIVFLAFNINATKALFGFFESDETEKKEPKSTIDIIKNRGFVKCGVTPGDIGLSYIDKDGIWHGMSVDICRALSFAIFGADKVEYVPMNGQNAYDDLRSGVVDILMRDNEVSLSRDISGVSFPKVFLFDIHGLLYRKITPYIKSASTNYSGNICINMGSIYEAEASNLFVNFQGNITFIPIKDISLIINTYENRGCDFIFSNTIILESLKNRLKNPLDHEVIGLNKFALKSFSPAIRHGDIKFEMAIKWLINLLIESERLNITSNNVYKIDNSYNNIVLNIFSDKGIQKYSSTSLGFDSKWAVKVIKNVGNYSEIYNRNLGFESTLKINRGINMLYTNGGLLISETFI